MIGGLIFVQHEKSYFSLYYQRKSSLYTKKGSPLHQSSCYARIRGRVWLLGLLYETLFFKQQAVSRTWCCDLSHMATAYYCCALPFKNLNILLAQFSFITNLISVSLFLVKESMSSNHVSCFFKFPIFFHVSYACTAFLAKSSLINLFCPLNHTGRGVSFFLLGRINSMVRPFILSIMLSINQTIQWRF